MPTVVDLGAAPITAECPLMTRHNKSFYKAGKAHTWLGLAKLVLSIYQPDLSVRYKTEVDNFCNEVIKLESESGTKYAVEYLKSSRLAVLRTITGTPLSSVGRVSLDSTG